MTAPEGPSETDRRGTGKQLRERNCSSLAAEINSMHHAAQRAAKTAVAHAIKAGELLLVAKSKVPHGAWLTWLSENCDFSPSTATGYMRLAQLPPAKRQRVVDFSLRQALEEIAVPREAKPRSCASAVAVVERVDHRDLAVEPHRDEDPETERALREREQIAALLLAWNDASDDAREQFVALKAKEIATVFRKWQA